METLDQYITSAPNPQNALDIFRGEWSSSLPSHLNHLQAGTVPLFEDARIEWAAKQFNGFNNKTILELGPLEAGHSYMLEKLGAASITSIEANTRAYLRCLVVKEILQLQRVHFLCGDFVEFLHTTSDHFDTAIASGVLYHMRNPVELIALLAKVCDEVLIWTHYYDPEIISANPNLSHKFSEGTPVEYNGFRHTLYHQEYKESLNWGGFCGGSAIYSNWMSREDIISCCKYFGFSQISIDFEQLDHVNGPCFALAAIKPSKQYNRETQLLRKQLTQQQSQIKKLEQALEVEKSRIAAIETSKFWKLRKYWFKVRKLVGVPGE